MPPASTSLSPEHAQELEQESAIAADVITARGYETITTKNALTRLGYRPSQGGEGPWLKIPLYGPGDTTPSTVQIKPTTPRPGRNGKPIKYESPRDAGVVLDVNPKVQGSLSDFTAPLWITEGTKKADAIVSAGGVALSLTGVWGWKMGSIPHEAWATIPLDGRDVYLAFDSDALDKASVWDALDALTTFLSKRKAKVHVVSLPKLHGLAKTGIDDFLASGAKLQEAIQYVGPLPQRPEDDRPGLNYRLPDGDIVSLTNFTARIVRETLYDDGQNVNREFRIRAETVDKTYEFDVPEEEFTAMEWPLKHIGATAIIYAFPGAKDKAREAIQLESSNVETVVAYRHTGWRKIDGKDAYLVTNGALTQDGLHPDVNVDLGLAGRYDAIALPDVLVLKSEAKRVLQRSWACVAPQTGVMPVRLYLAAFRATLSTPPFAAWVHGRTGCGKTTIATLLQAHWGKGLEAHATLASWADTENALEAVGYRLKDMALLVDDWRPKGKQRDREERKADRVIRSQANASGRARMTRSLEVKQGGEVRAMILSTGEGIPHGEPSLTARLLQVELDDSHQSVVERFKRMTLLQGYAARGDFAQAMTQWLVWLAPRLDKVRAAHAAGVEKARAVFSAHRAHARLTTMDADLYAFAQIFLGWLFKEGVLVAQEVTDALDALKNELLTQAVTQEVLVREHSDSVRLLDALRLAIHGEKARVDNLRGEISGLGDWVGWVENDGTLYLGLTALREVLVPLLGYRPTSQQIVKEVLEGGYVSPVGTQTGGGVNVIVKKYEGRGVRVLPVKKSILDET